VDLNSVVEGSLTGQYKSWFEWIFTCGIRKKATWCYFGL